MNQQATYRHDLGENLSLDAFSVDPGLSRADLMQLVKSKDGKPATPSTKPRISLVARLNSLEELNLEVLDGEYKVPEPLQSYRKAIGKQSDAKGRYNGPVAIVRGEVGLPLKVCQGGFYDYLSTRANDVPANIRGEFQWAESILLALETAKGVKKNSLTLNKILEQVREYADLTKRLEQYPEGKTVGQIMEENGFDENDRARYLGFAYLLFTDNGKSLTLVQRAKGMAVAPDCMAAPGSTPNPDFQKKVLIFKNIAENILEKSLRKNLGLLLQNSG